MGRKYIAVAALLLIQAPALAQEEADDHLAPLQLSAAEMFAFADAARDRGDFDMAERAYRALAANEKDELRREASFRLALMIADNQKRYHEAAVLLRQILDEQPDVARVRVELARMQAMMGNLREAEHELRVAQAIGLPPAVEQLVRFYAQALSANKPFGASLRVAIAPDSNINRATRSDTLETIIGDFTLSDDARENSGIGLSVQAQAYAKTGIDKRADLLVRLSASGDFYRDKEFDDYTLSFQAGPQYRLWGGQLSVAATALHRWFGQDPYSLSLGANAELRKPVSKTAQLRFNLALLDDDNKRNDLQDATRLVVGTGIDIALDGRSGAGASLGGSRFAARDPGYATTSGSVDAYIYREFGKTTAVVNVGYSHLEADKRLFLYPRRRVDDRYYAALSGTFRALRVGGFAPLIRVEYERNKSTVGLYDYDRLAGEIGVTAAF